MENCLNVPQPVLESMLAIAFEFLDIEEYNEKVLGTDWMSPNQAGPAWQELRACFEKLASEPHLPRSRKAVEQITPILLNNGLMLNGKQITRQAS